MAVEVAAGPAPFGSFDENRSGAFDAEGDEALGELELADVGAGDLDFLIARRGEGGEAVERDLGVEAIDAGAVGAAGETGVFDVELDFRCEDAARQLDVGVEGEGAGELDVFAALEKLADGGRIDKGEFWDGGGYVRAGAFKSSGVNAGLDLEDRFLE